MLRAVETVAPLPRALVAGDRVALAAPGGPVHAELLARGCAVLRAWGLEPVELPHVRTVSGFLAGADDERAADLHAAWADPSVAAIWCARGGHGCLRLLDRLDWSLVAANPKVFVGFSDVTALHLALHRRTGQVSFAGPNLQWDPARLGGPGDAAAASARRALMDPEPLGTLPARGRPLVGGTASGVLLGGNLSLLAATLGSPDAPRTEGALLLLEDVGERPYRIDRLLWQLQRAGVLERAAGLVLGGFTMCVPPPGAPTSVDDVLAEHARLAGIPAVTGLPLGHAVGQLTVPLGVTAVLDAEAGTLTFPQPATRRRAQPP